jgi:serine protease Do/serine protease DegQ
MHKINLFFRLAALISLIVTTPNLLATLPPHVDGQPLPTLAPMLEKVTPAVVNIAAIGEIQVRTRNSLFNDPFFQRFFDIPSRPQTKKTRSLGSGVVVDSNNGYVLTNHHVVEDAKHILVTFKDGRQLEAELIGSDKRTDVAVLKIPAKDISAVPMGDSEKLRVGDFAVAIGNPFGLGQTVTSGIVSALGRSSISGKRDGSENFEEFIQTDASINIGNSGGALVNLRGELIGINTAILSPSKTGGSVGIGFAIPVNMAKTVMQQLIEHGEIRRGYFGVVVQSVTPELAEALRTDIKQGAVVAAVEKDSPAEKSGLQIHDIVLEINGEKIETASEMRNRIGLMSVGDVVSMRVSRGGKMLNLQTKIEGDIAGTANGEQFDYRLAGSELMDITPDLPLYGKVQGVLVTDVMSGSPADSSGLEAGDIIVSVNKQKTKSIADIQRALRQQPSQLLMNIQRGRTAFFLLVK